jgi:hypothetical protein
MTIGAIVSLISTGVFLTPEGKAVAESPSLPGRPPVPPAWNMEIAKAGALRAPCPSAIPWPPRSVGIHRQDVPSAGTRPSLACSRQPSMTSGSIWPITWRVATAQGGGALRIEPAGAVTLTGASEPALFGTPPPTTQRTPKEA